MFGCEGERRELYYCCVWGCTDMGSGKEDGERSERELQCGGVAVWGGCGVGELRWGGVAVWGSCDVGELQCGGVVVWGSCGVGDRIGTR